MEKEHELWNLLVVLKFTSTLTSSDWELDLEEH